MRDLLWIKKAIENGDCKYGADAIGASDNPVIFPFENFIVQADECRYLDDELDIMSIDTDTAKKEIEEVAAQVEEATNLQRKVSTETLMFIQCLIIDNMLDEIDCGNYIIDRNFNLIKK